MGSSAPRSRHGVGAIALSTVCLSLLLASGCVGLRRWAQPVTVTEVVHLSQQGVPADKIIAKIERAGTVYKLDATHNQELAREGVSPPVIAHMQQTYRDAIEKNPKLGDRMYLHCWNMGYDGLWYGGSWDFRSCE